MRNLCRLTRASQTRRSYLRLKGEWPVVLWRALRGLPRRAHKGHKSIILESVLYISQTKFVCRCKYKLDLVQERVTNGNKANSNWLSKVCLFPWWPRYQVWHLSIWRCWQFAWPAWLTWGHWLYLGVVLDAVKIWTSSSLPTFKLPTILRSWDWLSYLGPQSFCNLHLRVSHDCFQGRL